jgi:6-phosphogluconolactonase
MIAGGGVLLSRSLVKVYPDPATMALVTAGLIVAEARRAVKARGRFTLALAGGATPRETYTLLSRPPFAALMPWEDVEVFWTDERCVCPDDPRSNERMARDALLDHVPIPPDRVHPMRCLAGGADGGDVDQAGAERAAWNCADRYDELLGAFFPTPAEQPPGAPGLDLVLLGLGANGHTASLFPGSEVLLEEKRRAAAALVDAAAGSGTTAAGRDLWRVTLTAAFINKAASVVFLVSGANKAGIVKAVLEGPSDAAHLPARLIHPEGGILRWQLDDDAASLLDGGMESS